MSEAFNGAVSGPAYEGETTFHVLTEGITKPPSTKGPARAAAPEKSISARTRDEGVRLGRYRLHPVAVLARMSKVRDWRIQTPSRGGFGVLLAATELERSWNGLPGIVRYVKTQISGGVYERTRSTNKWNVGRDACRDSGVRAGRFRFPELAARRG